MACKSTIVNAFFGGTFKERTARAREWVRDYAVNAGMPKAAFVLRRLSSKKHGLGPLLGPSVGVFEKCGAYKKAMRRTR